MHWYRGKPYIFLHGTVLQSVRVYSTDHVDFSHSCLMLARSSRTLRRELRLRQMWLWPSRVPALATGEAKGLRGVGLHSRPRRSGNQQISHAAELTVAGAMSKSISIESNKACDDRNTDNARRRQSPLTTAPSTENITWKDVKICT